jgi:hypothetical protein
MPTPTSQLVTCEALRVLPLAVIVLSWTIG